MIFLNQFWGWLTSSITSIMRNQVSLQIFMWWINGSQIIIDLKNCWNNSRSIILKKLDWGKGKFLLFCSLSREPCDLCQTKLMLWIFSKNLVTLNVKSLANHSFSLEIVSFAVRLVSKIGYHNFKNSSLILTVLFLLFTAPGFEPAWYVYEILNN